MKINESTKSALMTLIKGVVACVITFIGTLFYKENPDVITVALSSAMSTFAVLS